MTLLLHVVPHPLTCVGVCPSVRIDEVKRVVDGIVSVPLRSKTVVGRPLVSMDDGTRKDPSLEDRKKDVGTTLVVGTGDEETLTRVAINTPKHPHARTKVPPPELHLTKLTFVSLHNHSRASDRTRVSDDEVEYPATQNSPPLTHRLLREASKGCNLDLGKGFRREEEDKLNEELEGYLGFLEDTSRTDGGIGGTGSTAFEDFTVLRF